MSFISLLYRYEIPEFYKVKSLKKELFLHYWECCYIITTFYILILLSNAILSYRYKENIYYEILELLIILNLN